MGLWYVQGCKLCWSVGYDDIKPLFAVKVNEFCKIL